METTRKTILFAGSMYGGQFKSSTIATLGDCLQTLGHTVKYIALEVTENPVLKTLHPATTTQYDPRSGEALHQAIRDAIRSPEDIVIIDCPGGGWGEELPELAATAQSEFDTRIVIGTIVNAQCQYSLEGALEFTKAFSAVAQESIILANNWEETPNVLLESRNGKRLTEISKGRVIQFPTLSQVMRQGFNQDPAVPSAFIAKSDPFRAAPWKRFHRQCLESVSQHAEWLTGKPSLP